MFDDDGAGLRRAFEGGYVACTEAAGRERQSHPAAFLNCYKIDELASLRKPLVDEPDLCYSY